MGMLIEDGKGRGRMAAVNDDNRLEVASVVIPIINNSAGNGDTYTLLGNHTVQSADTEENVIYLLNSNTSMHIHVQSFNYAVFSTEAVWLRTYFAVTRTSGGTARSPTQLNRGSAKQAGITSYDNSSNDLVLVTTNQVQFTEVVIPGINTLSVCYDGAILMGPGDSLRVTAEGGDVGDKVTVGLLFYECSGESV